MVNGLVVNKAANDQVVVINRVATDLSDHNALNNVSIWKKVGMIHLRVGVASKTTPAFFLFQPWVRCA